MKDNEFDNSPQNDEAENSAEGLEFTSRSDLEDQLTAMETQMNEYKDKFLRQQAEFENFRKRTEKEKHEFFDYTLFHFVQGVLPVLDGLERGLAVTEGETVENYKKGTLEWKRLIFSEFIPTSAQISAD